MRPEKENGDTPEVRNEICAENFEEPEVINGVCNCCGPDYDTNVRHNDLSIMMRREHDGGGVEV